MTAPDLPKRGAAAAARDLETFFPDGSQQYEARSKNLQRLPGERGREDSREGYS